MQDQDCGHAIHGAGALFDREIELAEEAVGLAGAEAFVPQVDGQGELLAQIFGEELHFPGLNPFSTTQAQGVSDDDFGDFVLADDCFQACKVRPLIFAANGFEALSGDAERVGNGKADRPGAYVEAEDAGLEARGMHAGIIWVGKRRHRYVWKALLWRTQKAGSSPPRGSE